MVVLKNEANSCYFFKKCNIFIFLFPNKLNAAQKILNIGCKKQAGAKVGPDQLGLPVQVGSTWIDSDQLGSN